MTLNPANSEGYRAKISHVRHPCHVCPLSSLTTSHLASDFDIVQIPKWRLTFDLFANSGDDEKPSYAVISREWEKPRGRSNIGRLRLSKLGIRSDVEHLLSEKNRELHIGTIKDRP